MKQIKYLFLLALPVFFTLAACNGQGGDKGYVFKGTIKGAGNLQASLEQSYFDRTNRALGQAPCDADGNFKIQMQGPYEQGLYTLTIGAKKAFFILDGKEQLVEITGDVNTMDRMEVSFTGSEAATCYADFVKGLYRQQFKTADEAKSYISQKSCNPFMQAFFTMQLLGSNAASFLSEFKTSAKNLAAYMPGSKYAADFDQIISGLEKQMLQSQSAEAIQVGAPAPDISLPGPDGKVRSLSALKGKVVLIDFWASWCGPCRRANPHVVEVYKKYKNRGFDVFSVSLDREDGKDKWVQAIQQDGLEWDSHVSDLKYWNSAPAAVYGVRAIPKTFLVGRDGKIVAIDPRNNLEEELLKAL
jgi:thiol-disulfide isomerase/thioredoxin